MEVVEDCGDIVILGWLVDKVKNDGLGVLRDAVLGHANDEFDDVEVGAPLTRLE